MSTSHEHDQLGAEIAKLGASISKLLAEKLQLAADLAAANKEIAEQRTRLAELEQATVSALAIANAGPSPTDPARIPPAIRAGIDRYHRGGIRPGTCLYAVLSGDLFKAFVCADAETAAAMPAIVAFVRELPAECWGKADLVERWIARPRS